MAIKTTPLRASVIRIRIGDGSDYHTVACLENSGDGMEIPQERTLTTVKLVGGNGTTQVIYSVLPPYVEDSWTMTLPSALLRDPANATAADSTLYKFLNALHKSASMLAPYTSAPGDLHANTNPLTDTLRFMQDLEISYQAFDGTNTATCAMGAFYVNNYTLTNAHNGLKSSPELMGVEAPAWS